MSAGATARPGAGLAAFAVRLRAAAWLGLQIESNWTDPFLFTAYVVAFPLATAFILVGMYWAVGGHGAAGDAFRGFYVGSAFHNYVVMALVGMGWVIVEERELYETLKYVYTSPIGMFNYLAGRSLVKLALATLSAALTLLVGWFAAGVRWDWAAVRWLPLLLSLGVGLFAVVSFGFFVAGVAMAMPRAAFAVNDGVVVALYLLCGVIFPVDLLPRAVQWIALGLPFTWWYEALRRFLLGHGASARLGTWPDGALLAWLVVGAVAGFLASVLTGAHESLVTMIVLGIVGAVVGGWVASDLLHIADVTGINSTSIAVATIGAVIVILVVGSFNHRGRYGWRFAEQSYYLGFPWLSSFHLRCILELGYRVGELEWLEPMHVRFRPSQDVFRMSWKETRAGDP